MLDEWRPLLCPFDVTIMKGLSYLERFLPTMLPDEEMDQGFRYVRLRKLFTKVIHRRQVANNNEKVNKIPQLSEYESACKI